MSRLIFAVPDAPQQDHYLEMLAHRLEVPLETLRASISRPSAPRRPRAAQNRQPSAPAQDEATASPFARLDHDPLEEYCLSLLMRYPDLGEYAEPLTPELFLRPENREIFVNYLHLSANIEVEGEGNEELWQDVPPGVREQIESLRGKPLHPMDLVKRRKAMTDVVARLEERSLRQQKKDEHDRFADSTEELKEEDHRSAVALNERLRQNQSLRPSLRGRR